MRQWQKVRARQQTAAATFLTSRPLRDSPEFLFCFSSDRIVMARSVIGGFRRIRDVRRFTWRDIEMGEVDGQLGALYIAGERFSTGATFTEAIAPYLGRETT
ncbi:hypothetical protein [Demequina silvatica]|uniref:hypothetical protein n=1 Tax=Demequina silvatica TaxID=1638988 RepID=UPI0007814BEE|nr:hypothetical protein [Demequina silvatica]